MDKICNVLGLEISFVFICFLLLVDIGKGFILVQKMVGKVCGLLGICLGIVCELLMIMVGFQDMIGLMIRDEMKEFVCFGFSVDLVMQSFCYIVVYFKLVDIKIYKELFDFFFVCGGVVLCLGDGIIYFWLNWMLLLDIVGIGGDFYICFFLGIFFFVGFGLVVFVVVLGLMLLDMLELVLVRFWGEL